MKVCVQCGFKFQGEDWECPSCHGRPEIIGEYLAFSPELAKESNGFKGDYFEQLSNVEEESFWFRSRSRLIIWSLRKYFPNAENFFELGCGTGYVLSGIEKAFPKLKLYGGEVFVAGLDFASKRISQVELLQVDARKIPFQDEFEVLGAFDVLEHIKNDEDVLRQMYRAVRHGGGIVLSVPQHPFLWSRADDYAQHVRRYTAEELRTKVKMAGFEILRVTSFVSILLPIMMISRLKDRRSDLAFDPMSEFKISSLMNTLLEKMLGFERFFIRLGLSMPIGGSLLLVARKG
jgi:SAM-dependent methyltransferase